MAGKTHHFTLLDGEMVIDISTNGKQERRYLIYDLMALNEKSVMEVRHTLLFWELLFAAALLLDAVIICILIVCP